MVALRPATHADVPALLALWEVAAENDSRPVDDAAAVERLLERDPDACLVAEAEGRLVGSIVAGWDGWRAHLYRLAVHPDARRQGVATALLEAASTRLEALGASRLDAMVLEGNDLGQSLWRGAGFAPQPAWRRWVRAVGPRA
ncbi:GNAT family N-acetyltransferase [Nocardioides bruguierae]|uniref:GNAT family N-acetyltransferase n=1 Tax=Nocardioides bruguierae TaxID=2945102 RepID=A0A9X2IGY2_9ACTN|nr:GNAT family N-acetyltransferase [Nocardioides bruguierae]MCM0622044.1 GNAT family N-acetyltransferase [Nocardioides bruguierae]